MALASPSSTTTSISLGTTSRAFSYIPSSTLSLKTSSTTFPITSSRVGELGFDIAGFQGDLEKARARKLEIFDLNLTISTKCILI